MSSATRKYAGKVRLGRGFTLVELKKAGISAKFARTVGISVDHRRTSMSEEQLQLNVARLNQYKSKMILFPRKENKPKKGEICDATAAQLKSAAASVQAKGFLMPIAKAEQKVEFAAITEADKKERVFHTLRTIRTNTRYAGRRTKRIADAEAAKK